jgi:hypothetical protein
MASMTLIADGLRTDLISEMPLEQVFQKHLIDGSSVFFTDHLKQANWEYQLRHKLAETLNTSINDVVIVGSAKLGFSVKTREFNVFDFSFSQTGNPQDKSDIDVAVVNKKLFEATTESIFHLSRHFDNDWIHEYWRINQYYGTPRDIFSKYTHYLARGWLRPDFMPGKFLAYASWRPICDDWYKKLDRRKVSVGFYSDWVYLKHYQMDNLQNVRTKLRQLEI